MPKKAQTTTAGNRRTGVISTTQKGAGYIDDPDPKKDSIYIEPGFLNTALNGDTVEVALKEKNIRGKKQIVGEVVKVVNRNKANYVGIVGSDSQGFYITPDDRKMYVNIRIASNDSNKNSIQKDDKVQVKLNPWTNSKIWPTGAIIKILGKRTTMSRWKL